MNVNFITQNDLNQIKNEIVQELNNKIQSQTPKKWLRSSAVLKMLSISAGTLQNFRINGLIPHTKIGGTFFYDYEEIIKVLNENKRID